MRQSRLTARLAHPLKSDRTGFRPVPAQIPAIESLSYSFFLNLVDLLYLFFVASQLLLVALLHFLVFLCHIHPFRILSLIHQDYSKSLAVLSKKRGALRGSKFLILL